MCVFFICINKLPTQIKLKWLKKKKLLIFCFIRHIIVQLAEEMRPKINLSKSRGFPVLVFSFISFEPFEFTITKHLKYFQTFCPIQ